jgi:hypothetical protein
VIPGVSPLECASCSGSMRGMGLRTLRPHAGRRGSSEPIFASTVPRDAHCALSAAFIACTTATFSLLCRASTSLPSGSTMIALRAVQPCPLCA